MTRHRSIIALAGLLAPVFAFAAGQAQNEKETPSEIMAITTANLRGHESLYSEGWFLVSSSEKALAYAKEKSIDSSGQAMAQMQADLARHSGGYVNEMVDTGTKSVKTGVDTAKLGTALTKAELAATGHLMLKEIDYGSRTMQLAWERFYKGNITLAQRTEEDRAALAAVPGNYYRGLKRDFRNLYELTESVKGQLSTNIEGHWSESFGEARGSFSEAYEKSSTRGNSLTGLGDIMVGYGQALYAGLVKPAARTTVQGAEVVGKSAAKVVFLPVASLFIVTGRTIASAGMSLYYTTSTGIKLVSPTIEGGLLAGLSLLSYSAVPVTGAVGGAAGLVNQVAVTAAAPAAAAGQAIVTGTGETAYYAAQVSYDLVKGATVVTMNQAQAGVVLGYNALTAVPTQALLGVANGVVFLAWDGPRLVLASAKGEVAWNNDAGEEKHVPVTTLPVGSVVDLQALSQEKGVSVEVISDDPEVVQQVLEKLPNDLRVGGQP